MVVILILILLYLWYYHVLVEKSAADGHTYRVLNRIDSGEAAELLDSIHDNNVEFIEYLGRTGQRRDIVQRLRENYHRESLRENHPTGPDNTSYTEDKGRILALCLRRPGGFVDPNMIRFVTLHELAHIATPDYGHPHKFWGNFKFLLHHAHRAGFYIPDDYSSVPQNYCGLKVDYNPLFDDSLKIDSQ